MIFIIFCILYSLLDAIHDYCFINDIMIRSYRVWHSVDFAIKGLVILAIGYFSLYPIIFNWLDILILLYTAGTIRWILHDLIYNFLSGYKWYYIGTGWLDKVFKFWQFHTKILLFVGLIIIYIV